MHHQRRTKKRMSKQMKKRVLFIINPISGLGKHKTIEKSVVSELDKSKIEYHFEYTQYPHHATEITRANYRNYDIIVAVGGDGTVNEVASGLIDTNTALAIIPAGSGNGLARHLNIPLKVNKAIQLLNDHKVTKIDSLKINDQISVNVSGIGFDAFISHLFAKTKRRGPLTYIHLITREFPNYKSDFYTLKIDGQAIALDAFLISFANSSQYGNNLQIAPNAMVDDGFIDVCIIKDFPKYTAPALLLSLFDPTIDRSKFDIIKRAKNITIEHPVPLKGHIDGEAVEFGNKVEISICPLSLNVVIPLETLKPSNIFDPIMDLMPNFLT